MSNHTWYPQNDPLAGDPNSADALALLAELHAGEDAPWADKFLTADDRKTLSRGN